jgi:hypothetical protein
MTTRTGTWFGLAALLVLCCAAIGGAQETPAKAESFSTSQWETGIDCHILSGPFTHGNLTIFLLHGKDMHPAPFATLKEAIATGYAVVNETGNVNQLTIENNSPELDIFIQSGDIVKGGRQDRVIASDLIVPARSGTEPVKFKIDSFCCEHGRWSQRGKEDAAKFESSEKAVAGKELKKAVALDKDQKKVWDEVALAQRGLMMRVGRVQAAESPTSLQLTLEDKKLQDAADKYRKELSKITEGKKDVIGFAFAINGQMNGAEVYGSHMLFEKLWPKLIEAAIVEAVAEQAKAPTKDRKEAAAAVTAETAKNFLNECAKGKVIQEREAGSRVKVVTKEGAKTLFWETRDRGHKDAIVHRSYLMK